ncbi:MAG: AMP-binding protein [Haloarculaceae archaeon]
MTGGRDSADGSGDAASASGSRDGWPTRDVLSHRAAATPERTALVDTADGTAWTYRELDRVVDGVAAALGQGGPVGTLLGTRVAFVTLVHAAMRTGRTLVPLNVQLPADTLAGQARRAEVDVLVCGRDTEETAREVAPGPVASVDPPERTGVDRLAPGPRDGTGTGVEGETQVPVPLSPSVTAVVMFTSGTTGIPKGVRLTVGNLVWSAVASAFRLGVDPDDRWLCCLPMYHMGGLAPTVRCAMYGTSLAIQPGFEAEGTAEVIEEHGVTGVSLVPTQLRRLLDTGWEPPAGFGAVLLGGAPSGEDLLDRARDRGVPVYPTYGTTETASQVATATPAQAAEYGGTVGQPLAVTDVTVLADGEPAEPGEVGELVVRGPTVTPGYLDDDRTAEAVGSRGFHTGDLGYRDEAGRLWVEGRVDDAITTGGETVYPATVVDALREHPGVADAAVVGLPDEEWGERVAALVVPADAGGDGREGNGSAPTPGELREFCRGRVAGYAVPKTIGLADDLPRTASGTVDREAVRDRLRSR